MKNCLFCDTYIEEYKHTCKNASCRGKYARSCRKSVLAHTKYNDPIYKQRQKEAKIKSNLNRYGPIIEIRSRCRNERCQEEFTVKYREKTGLRHSGFCCQTCANTVTGLKCRDKLKDVYNDPNWGFKNKEHQVKATELSMQTPKNDRRMSSQGERDIRSFFKNKDPDWSAHRIIESKAVDLLHKNKKIIFEYDGPTHFRDIYKDGSFEDQQQKDNETMLWVRNNDYKIYRISELYFIKVFDRIAANVFEDVEDFLKTNDRVRIRYLGGEEKY
jgi:very-short-patch-repair endonuclease